jgi:hypothetical protein
MGEACEIADTNYNLNKLNQSMITRFMSIFRDPNVAKHLSLLYDKYVIVSADKVPNKTQNTKRMSNTDLTKTGNELMCSRIVSSF